MNTLVNAILLVAALLLTASVLVAVERIAKGPSQLDRSIGSDLMVGVVISSVGVWATYSDQDTEIILPLLLSMVGFTGAVSIARLVSERVVFRPKTGEKTREPRR